MNGTTKKYWDIYLSMYYFLDKYWKRTYDSEKRIAIDDLGGLLGCMSPTLWSDGLPIDKLIVADWEDITQKREDITQEEGFRYMIQFLEKQSNWLKLEMLISELKVSTKLKDDNWKIWLDIF